MRVFITGATSGIGHALALHYGRAGGQLGLTARREPLLQGLVAEFGERNVLTYRADVRDGPRMQEVAQDFMANFGVPDIVIANAGISHGTQAQHAEDVDAFQDVIDTNLIGMVKTFQPFIAPMCRQGQGKLVGIASVAGVRGLPGAGAYSSSKAAAINYLESLRSELQSHGVQVITLMPGFIATPMTERNPYPMPFIISADDAARRMAHLIERGRRVAVTPWPMAIVAGILRSIPAWAYDRLTRHAPRKPRRDHG